MKILLCPVIPLLFLFSCHSGAPVNSARTWPGIPDSTASRLPGTYSGRFKDGFLTLVINYVSGSNVSGYRLHKGIRRNLNGLVEEKDGQYSMTLKEPGGYPFDGTFYLSMDRSAQKITGNWIPIDSTRTRSGLLTLARSVKPADDDYFFGGEWNGTLGTLSFSENNTCELEYYPDSLSSNGNPQLMTVTGNFEKKEDTIRIEWQNNNHTPSVHMRLVREQGVEQGDSMIPENLHGGGLRFTKFIAG